MPGVCLEVMAPWSRGADFVMKDNYLVFAFNVKIKPWYDLVLFPINVMI